MGPDEPLPDDVRRLLENESPAVMARELLRVRALADAHVDALDALRKDLAETRKDREEARAGAKGVWEDLAKARVEVIRLRAEIERLRGDDSRTWLVVELAQTAGVKVTIDEVSSGARTLASVYDAAVVGILETRRLAERYLAEPATDLYRTAAHETRQILSAALGVHADGVPITDLPRQAREVVSQRNTETARACLRDATIDETHRVLDEAGVAKENGQALTLWDRVELLVDERDGARARVGAAPAPFVVRREVGDNVVEIRAPTLPDLEGAIAAVTKALATSHS